jgi:hypothetical protein
MIVLSQVFQELWSLTGFFSDNATDTGNSNIGFFEVHDEVLSQSQINEYVKQFQRGYGTTEQKRNFVYPKASDLSKEVDSKVGTQLITNGDFSAGETGWTLGGGWEVVDGKAVGTATAYNITPTISLVSGRKYQLIIDYVRTAGTLYYYNGASLVSLGTTSEKKVITFTAGGTSFYFAASTFTGSIDNVSLQELTGLVAAFNFIPS